MATPAIPSVPRSIFSRIRSAAFTQRRLVSNYLARAFRKPRMLGRSIVTGAVEKPALGIAVAVALLLTCFAGTALIMRVSDPTPLMIVEPFEVPPERPGADHKPGLIFSGRTVANLLVDDLHNIIRTASGFQGLELSSRKQFGKLPEAPTIPIETSFGLQFHGISVDQLVSVWHYLRYDEEFVSGDVINDGEGTITLEMRLISSDSAHSWSVTSVMTDASDLRSAIFEVARRCVSDMNPEIMGRYYLGLEEYSGAEDLFRTWLHREPDRPEPYFYLAYTMDIDSKNRPDAELILKRALSISPAYYRAVGELAWIYEQRGQDFRQDDLLRKAIELHGKANAMAPGAPNYLNNLAAEHERFSHHEVAEKYARAALRLDNKMTLAVENLGNSLEGQGKLDAAIAEYRRSLILKPDFSLPLDDLRRLLVKTGKIEEAIDECRTAAVISPDRWEPRFNLGKALLAKGDSAGALDAYREALRVGRGDWAKRTLVAALRELVQAAPDNPEPHYELVGALESTGDFAAAELERRSADALRRKTRQQ
jgi:tetratricopeptide (TPR) repeat protein